METKRIIISVTSDLSTDQRVQKTTQTLHEAGFNVLLVGRKTRKSLPFKANYPFRQFRLLFNSSFEGKVSPSISKATLANVDSLYALVTKTVSYTSKSAE